MAARQLEVLTPRVHRPDERRLAPADREGPYIVIPVVSAHLNGQPVDMVRISPAVALEFAEALVAAARAQLDQR